VGGHSEHGRKGTTEVHSRRRVRPQASPKWRQEIRLAVIRATGGAGLLEPVRGFRRKLQGRENKLTSNLGQDISRARPAKKG